MIIQNNEEPPKSGLKLPKGVLKIKKGFNPNSSSIGTVVFSFPVVLTAVGTVLAALKIFIKKSNKSNEK